MNMSDCEFSTSYENVNPDDGFSFAERLLDANAENFFQANEDAAIVPLPPKKARVVKTPYKGDESPRET